MSSGSWSTLSRQEETENMAMARDSYATGVSSPSSRSLSWRIVLALSCLRTEILLVRSSRGALTVRRHVRTCADQQRTSRRGSLGAACRLNCCTAARVVRENTTAPAHALVL